MLAAPSGAKLLKGIVRANIAVVRHVYEALAEGSVVCSEDIAVVLALEQRGNEVKGVSDRHLRGIMWALMKDIGQGVSDVCVREVRRSERMAEQHLCTCFPRTSMSTCRRLRTESSRGCTERTKSSVNSCRRLEITI